MKLSYRLRQVAEMITPCEVVADVGTDHGYVPIYLIQHGICKKAIAMDINAGPLRRAKDNICREHLTDLIETRRSDGLQALREDEADAVVMSGIGGELMIRILEDGKQLLRTVSELVLSPHSELALVRKYLTENDFYISDETMLIDEDKFYTILKVSCEKDFCEINFHENISQGKEESYTELELNYGRILLRKKDKVLFEYLKREKNKYNQIAQRLQENAAEHGKIRLEEIRKQIKLTEQALNDIV